MLARKAGGEKMMGSTLIHILSSALAKVKSALTSFKK